MPPLLSAETQVARAQDIRFQLSGKHVSYSELSAASDETGQDGGFCAGSEYGVLHIRRPQTFCSIQILQRLYGMDQSSLRWRLCIKQRHLKKVMAFGFKPKCMLLLQFMK